MLQNKYIINNFLQQNDTQEGFDPFNLCLVFTITFSSIQAKLLTKAVLVHFISHI